MTANRRLWFGILELEHHGRRWAIWTQFAIGGFILLNLAATVLETVPAVSTRYYAELAMLHEVAMVLFTVELAIRIANCAAHHSGDYAHPLWGRIRYLVSTMTLLDVAVVVPHWLGLGVDLRFLRAFRLLRLLDFLGYGAAIKSLAAVFYNERKALIGAFVVMLIALFVTSCLMYLIEHPAQPNQFSSIFAALWWGLATFATIGYGDITPVTPLGRVLTGIAAIFGIAMFALPAGILASGYATELKRRDFVTTWDLVARVPLFAKLAAVKIADVAALLRVRHARAGETIIRKGDPAHSMFFIADGEVVVNVKPRPVALRTGDFFGEMGLMERTPRSATITATRNTRLLVLEAQDLARFLDGNPSIRDALTRATAERMLEQQEADGDPLVQPSLQASG